MNKERIARPGGLELIKVLSHLYAMSASGKTSEASALAEKLLTSIDWDKPTSFASSSADRAPQLTIEAFSTLDEILNAIHPREGKIYMVTAPSGAGKSSIAAVVEKYFDKCVAVDIDDISFRNSVGWSTEALTARNIAEEMLYDGYIPIFVGTSHNLAEVAGFLSSLAEVRVIVIWPCREVLLNAHFRRLMHEPVTKEKVEQLIQIASRADGSGVVTAKNIMSLIRSIYPGQVKIHTVRLGYIRELAALRQTYPGRSLVEYKHSYTSMTRLWKTPALRPVHRKTSTIVWNPQANPIVDYTYEKPLGRWEETLLPAWCLRHCIDMMWPAHNVGAVVRRFLLEDLRPTVVCPAAWIQAAKIEVYPTLTYVDVSLDDSDDKVPDLTFEGFSPRMDGISQEAVQLLIPLQEQHNKQL